MIALDPHAVARALGGNVSGCDVVAPGPGHSRADRSLSVKLDPSAPDGFIVHSFAGDVNAESMCELHLGSTRDSGDPAGKPQCEGRTAPPWRWNGTRITARHARCGFGTNRVIRAEL